MSLEDKVRRRLAPFIVEGRIAKPHFSLADGVGDSQQRTVNVDVRPIQKTDGLERALQIALRDLGGAAKLIIHPL